MGRITGVRFKAPDLSQSSFLFLSLYWVSTEYKNVGKDGSAHLKSKFGESGWKIFNTFPTFPNFFLLHLRNYM